MTPQHPLIITILLILIIVSAIFSGCTGSYVHRATNTYANVSIDHIYERDTLQVGSMTFSCYAVDSGGIVYKVRFEQDCARFVNGGNYTIEQDSLYQDIVYAERAL